MWAKTCLESSFGCWEIQGSELGISGVRRIEHSPCPKEADTPEVLQEAVRQLSAYFEGQLHEFDLTLDFGAAPDFHVAVWRELLRIPYGHTSSYRAIAEALGNPAAVRAVGQANARNPIAIIVPCHRCIAKNGDLQGYFYGLDMKRALLELENPSSFARQGSFF